MHLRDSADGVVVLIDTDDDVSCFPIEVKSRCSPRTYSKEMKQFDDVRRMMEIDDGLPVEGDDNRPLFVAINGMIDDTATDDDNSANSDSGEHYTDSHPHSTRCHT